MIPTPVVSEWRTRQAHSTLFLWQMTFLTTEEALGTLLALGYAAIEAKSMMKAAWVLLSVQ